MIVVLDVFVHLNTANDLEDPIYSAWKRDIGGVKKDRYDENYVIQSDALILILVFQFPKPI